MVLSLMPYRFTFDLTRLPRELFQEIARITYDKGVHKKVGRVVRELVDRFRVHELTGLNFSDAITLLEDFIDIQVSNLVNRERFLSKSKKVLFLPHCARKYMDSRCKAIFDPSIPSYICQHCSPDCLINQATRLAESKGYDVYVLPGGSCIPKILQAKGYEAVVGVACGEEVKLGIKVAEKFNIPVQAVPLLKNGCANTWFNIETLKKIL